MEFYAPHQLSSPQNCRNQADAAHVADLVEWGGDRLASRGPDASGDGWDALKVPDDMGGGWLLSDDSDGWAFTNELPR